MTDNLKREQALDPASSFVVHAPAGSGKTTLLTLRFLNLLKSVDEPEKIVALTFTRKAAEEMRIRILDSLALAEQPQPEEAFELLRWSLGKEVLRVSGENNWDLPNQQNRLRIMTIDAYSQSLIRQMPITASFAGAPDIREDAHQLYKEAADRAISKGLSDQDGPFPLRLLLKHVNNDWSRLETLLIEMLGRRNQWLSVLGSISPRTDLEVTARAYIEQELGRLAVFFPPKNASEMVSLANYAATHIKTKRVSELKELPSYEFDQLVYWIELLRLFVTNDGKLRKKVNRNDGFPAELDSQRKMKERWAKLRDDFEAMPDCEEVFACVCSLPSEIFADDEWELLGAMMDLLRSATAELMMLEASTGQCDFTAISIAALQAIGPEDEPTDLMMSLDYQIQHLLVDEFQDTSVCQYDLILGLIAGWVNGDGKTLFVVGDPMQSIYRFRQAEVGLFQRVLREEKIGSLSLKKITLTSNFRSQSSLVEWVSKAMLAAIQRSKSDPRLFVEASGEFRLSEEDPVSFVTYDGLQKEDEADRVASLVASLQVRDPDASIAILVRSRLHLELITERLVVLGVDVRTSNLESLSDLPWISDLVALARALLHPADHIAWLAVLRGPWIGLSLDTLYKTKKESSILSEGILSLAAKIKEWEPEYQRVQEAARAISVSQELINHVPFATVVERLWVALDGPDLLSDESYTEELVAYKVNSVQEFFRILRKLSLAEEPLSAEKIQRSVENAFAQKPISTAKGVHVMTIHGAKGLEFDHVILPSLGRPPQSAPRPLLVWRQELLDEGRSALIIAPHPSDRESELFSFLWSREKHEAKQESLRVLYVALTRAKKKLHLFMHVRVSDGVSKAEKGSFAELLWDTLEGHIQLESVPAIDQTDRELRCNYFKRVCAQEQLRQRVYPRTEVRSFLNVVEFDWAGPTAKQIGTVSHRILQDLSGKDIESFEPETIWRSIYSDFAHGMFRSLGLASDDLPESLESVRKIFLAVLGSERGKWLFSTSHSNACSELVLSSSREADSGRVVIDRTFVDRYDTRWIVDFKTGTHRGGSREQWLDREWERYLPQLRRYARALAAKESRKINLALYFPTLDGWRSGEYAG